MSDVAKQRYPQALNRVLNVFGAVMVVVSAVTPAGAVWVIASVLLQNQGAAPFGAWCWQP